MVLRLTLKVRALSASGSPRLSRRRIASRRWCGVSLGLRPSFTPRALARSRPSPPGANQVALEFGQAPQHGEHQAPVAVQCQAMRGVARIAAKVGIEAHREARTAAIEELRSTARLKPISRSVAAQTL